MNDQQETFCLEYIKDKNASAAAIRAGYAKPGDYGRVLYTKSHVRARIDELLAEVAEVKKVDAGYVIERFMIEAEGKGPDTNSASRIAAADKLAKHLGFYEQDNKQKAQPLRLIIEEVGPNVTGEVPDGD